MKNYTASNSKGEDFVVGDAVVYTKGLNNYVHHIDYLYLNNTACLHHPLTGFVSDVSIEDLRHATITEIKCKKRGEEPVALFVSDLNTQSKFEALVGKVTV